MKYILLPVMLLFMCSCTDIVESKLEFTEFDITDSLNYENSKDLKGLAEFQINKTTVKDIKAIYDEIQKSNKYYLRFDFKPDYSDGFTGIYLRDTLYTILEKETTIRQFRFGSLGSEYRIGEIEIDRLFLLCYNDTLIGIEIKTPPDVIVETFISKYGSGKGYKNTNSFYFKDSKNDKVDLSEHRTWENNSLISEYHMIFESKPNQDKRFHENLIIRDKTGKFEQFQGEIAAIKNKLKQEKDEKLQKSIEMI